MSDKRSDGVTETTRDTLVVSLIVQVRLNTQQYTYRQPSPTFGVSQERTFSGDIHRVSKKNCAKLFSSELLPTVKIFGTRMAESMPGGLIFHLTKFMSTHYTVKRSADVPNCYITL